MVDPFFKVKTPRDKKYLEWIKEQPCFLSSPYYMGRCNGDVEAAHMTTGGKGIKASDYHCLPLCYTHHMEEHGGRETFAEKYNLNIWKEIACFNGRYIVKLRREDEDRRR